jgi:hypothetical protein
VGNKSLFESSIKRIFALDVVEALFNNRIALISLFDTGWLLHAIVLLLSPLFDLRVSFLASLLKSLGVSTAFVVVLEADDKGGTGRRGVAEVRCLGGFLSFSSLQDNAFDGLLCHWHYLLGVSEVVQVVFNTLTVAVLSSSDLVGSNAKGKSGDEGDLGEHDVKL